MRRFSVYGYGHLADTLRAELETRSSLATDDERREVELGFIAHDVTDHLDADRLTVLAHYFYDATVWHPYVVVLSQVPPGWVRKAADNRRGVFYQVDTIIVKQAVARMLRPEQFIVGCADPEASLPLAYQEYLAAHECPVLQMSYESAEMAKLGINYVLSKQIEAANELKLVCGLVGADYADVRAALHNDARIGPLAYLAPGKTNRHLQRDVETIKRTLDLGAL